MPLLRIRGDQGQRLRQEALQILRQDIRGVDRDRDVVDEAVAAEIPGHGQPHAQRRQTRGHNRRPGNIVEDGLRMEDEGLHGGLGDPERRDAVGKSMDR